MMTRALALLRSSGSVAVSRRTTLKKLISKSRCQPAQRERAEPAEGQVRRRVAHQRVEPAEVLLGLAQRAQGDRFVRAVALDDAQRGRVLFVQRPELGR